MPLSILKDLVRRLIPFLVLLGLLLVFTAYFNMHYDWYGISLVTRAYIFMLSFFIVFNYASIDLEERKEAYPKNFGKSGLLRLFLHSRVVPFLIIFLISVLYTCTEYTGSENWFFNSVAAILDGEYVNIVFYSLLLLVVMKLKKNPGYTVPLFVILSVSFFFLDQVVYESIQGGTGILVMKGAKAILLAYLLLQEFFGRDIGMTAKGALSAVFSMLVIFAVAWSFHLVYVHSERGGEAKTQAGFTLMRYGMAYPMPYLQEIILEKPSYREFSTLIEYSEYSDAEFTCTASEWKSLLFAENVQMADLVSKYLLHEQVILSYEELVRYAMEKSLSPDEKLEGATNYIRLTARYCDGYEKDLMCRIRSGNEHFTLWGLGVISRHKKLEYIPFLVSYLTHVQSIYENAAYGALVAITGEDPAAQFNYQVNAPDTILFFRDYYMQNRSTGKQDN